MVLRTRSEPTLPPAPPACPPTWPVSLSLTPAVPAPLHLADVPGRPLGLRVQPSEALTSVPILAIQSRQCPNSFGPLASARPMH